MKRRQWQQGFTLVEIAVVLVIIGLLLGGVLKGQELIASARVRNMADQQAGIQAAYYGFIDRYRAVPGDMLSTNAAEAIGVAVADITGGDGDGKLGDPSMGDWDELNAVWEHLSKAGFIKGSYDGSGAASTADDAPINVFNGVLVLGRHDGYLDTSGDATTGASSDRLLLTMGQNVPVDIARELDVKIDDGDPEAGILRNAVEGTGVFESNSTATSCTTGTSPDMTWDIGNDSQDCNPAYIF